jgi:glutamate synthase (NADPH/NADH) small chain
MGKPTGFIEYQRQSHAERSPRERLGDYEEFRLPGERQQLLLQAARCMDCGTPFCHTGALLNGAASGCPINNLIPEWNDLVYRELWQEALERLHKTNNFPEFTGRVCPAPCEGACVLGINTPPVTIKDIECEIIDHAWTKGWVQPEPPPARTGKKVAIVGSGPAGLAAAAQLNQAGHWVTVFERADRLGGLLMYGIPNMKLDKRLVMRRINLLEREGITFLPNHEVGANYPAQRLLAEFEAVVLCTGATTPRDLAIEGRQLKGIHFAMDFLRANTESLLNRTREPLISARDKQVMVIGGGDTGTDCAGTCLRQGCQSLLQVEILPRPPLERAPDNPWPEWPKIHRVEYGQEEAAAAFGADPRVFLTTARKFVGGEDGQVKQVLLVEVQWQKDPIGRWTPKEVQGTERLVPAQLVLLALGFVGPEQPLLAQLGVERDPRSNVKAEYGKFLTSARGVFAAGDCRRGQSLVVWAINEGRAAARECDRFLMGASRLP